MKDPYKTKLAHFYPYEGVEDYEKKAGEACGDKTLRKSPLRAKLIHTGLVLYNIILVDTIAYAIAKSLEDIVK